MTEIALIASDPVNDPLSNDPLSNDASDPNTPPYGGAIDSLVESGSSQVTASPIASKIAQHNAEIKIFISTFFTIFLAELGDKTQLTTLLMVAGTRSPWVIFLGAGIALVLTTLIGVLLGRWIATKTSPRTLETSAGAMLLLISVLLLWDVVNL